MNKSDVCYVRSNLIRAIEWKKGSSNRSLHLCQADFNAHQWRWLNEKNLIELFDSIESNSSLSSHFCGWNAHDELQEFQSHHWLGQNRLLNDLPFEVPDSFTSFRKKVELILPDFFEQAFVCEHPLIIDELDWYFHETTLPSNYFETRNALLGRENRTNFSTMLSIGVVDVRELWNRTSEYEQRVEKNKSTYWIKFELLWREFFYWHYQKWGRCYFSANGIKGERDFSPYPIYQIEQLKKNKHPRVIQACLNELSETGYMTNRTRQWFASYWINDLAFDWRSGAQLFENYLVDYDVFSNWGNWMYLAGVGVDPRGSRYFNLEKQINQYDPNREYVNEWC